MIKAYLTGQEVFKIWVISCGLFMSIGFLIGYLFYRVEKKVRDKKQ